MCAVCDARVEGRAGVTYTRQMVTSFMRSAGAVISLCPASADGGGKVGQPLFPLGRPQSAAQPSAGASAFSSFPSNAGHGSAGVCTRP